MQDPWVTWGFGPRDVDKLEVRVVRTAGGTYLRRLWRKAKKVLPIRPGPVV